MIVSGNIVKKAQHCVPQRGYTLYVGDKCNDGRPITESWKFKRARELGLNIVCLKAQREEEQKKEKIVKVI